MTAGEFLAALTQLPLGSLQDITASAPFVVLSPHPDDETLGAGGLLAATCATGQRADIVVITDGSGSHPRSKEYPAPRLIALREAEVEAAGALLGLEPDSVRHLGLPDTQAPSSGPDFDAAVEEIVDLCTKAGAKSLFVTWDGDPHCDHEATARMALAVRQRMPDLKLWAYPIWGWHLDPALPLDRPPPTGFRLDISAQQAIKRSAIAAHVSQMTTLIDDDPEGFRFTDTTLAPLLGPFEYFIEVAMSRKTETIPPEYFEDKYRSDIDPWQFRSSDYEREKYQATIAALDRPRYARALEVGCSIGVFTRLLAPRCDTLLAIDASATAIAAAQEIAPEKVIFKVGTLPQDFPPGPFDLIVVSEVLYYFVKADLQRVAALCLDALAPGGEIIACHWLGETNYPLTGTDASELFAAAVAVRLPIRVPLRDEVYRLERWSAF